MQDFLYRDYLTNQRQPYRGSKPKECRKYLSGKRRKQKSCARMASQCYYKKGTKKPGNSRRSRGMCVDKRKKTKK